MRQSNFCFLSRHAMAARSGERTVRRRLSTIPMAESDQPDQPEPPKNPKHPLPQHLARQLSKFTITAEEQGQWSKTASQFPKDWNKYPVTCEETDIMVHSFPTYESLGLKNTHKASFGTNVLLEVRDVRVPASCHHPSYSRLARHRKHLICYTHADLINAETRNRVQRWTKRSWPDSECMFVDTRETRSDATPFSDLRKWIIKAVEQEGGNNFALTVGVPNTGKSSMLLAMLRSEEKILRQRPNSKRIVPGKPQVENAPGKTRDFSRFVLQEKPRLYCVDVPGVSPPVALFAERPEAWYALCAANLLSIRKAYKTVETDTKIAEYVLFALNRDRNFAYVKKLGLDGPTCDINVAVSRLRLGGTGFLKLFNTGNFGAVVLDDLEANRGCYEFFEFTDEKMSRASEMGWKPQ